MEISQQLFDFIQSSPSMFHTIQTIRTDLENEGFMYLAEGRSWTLEKGGKYYTTRNHSSIIAFTIGQELDN